MSMSDDEMTEGDPTRRIVHLTLDEKSVLRRNADVEHERAVAIFDLLDDNNFDPIEIQGGPFHLHLGIEDDRLVFDIRDLDGAALDRIALSLTAFRTVVKDYFTICESYYAAIKKATHAQIEALDMARRAVHNEGSEFLKERLAEKVRVDLNTARRLFTLICVLHIRG